MTSLKDSTTSIVHAKCTAKMIDDEVFRTEVLRQPPNMTEDELEHLLEVEARVLGIKCRPSSADPLTYSTSAMTIASDSEKPCSAISQSTDPTSCSSSDRRLTFQSPFIQTVPSSPTRSIAPSLYSFTEKKASALRNGIRNMSMFRKRTSATSSAALISTRAEQGFAAKESLESPLSTVSRQSSWSTSVPTTAKLNVGDPSSDDAEAVTRTEQCVELHELQVQQRDERDRFLEYQRKCLADMRAEHEKSRKQKIESQTAVIEENRAKNEKSIADLESRQLEGEMKLMEELDAEKRTCVIRLRHMEAYCHSPSPPRTPPSARSSFDSAHPNLLHRKITEKDFNNLAQQYRERDTMENLHRAKIDVLRGRQERQFSDYAAKKSKDINDLEAEHSEAIKKADEDARAEEEALNLAFAEKKYRLERRWRLETKIEVAKHEKNTGLKLAKPPDILIGDP